MNPTNPNRRRREPSVAEVAALTRRLRELSAQGRTADPAQRAAFLADKDALLARIADAHSDPDRRFLPTDATGREPHSHQALTGRTDEVADDPPVEMPEWMREQARRTEAKIAAGNAPPSRPDDLDELAARVAALRERIAAPDIDASTAARGADPEQDVRVDQLARWHHDDDTTSHDTEVHDAAAYDATTGDSTDGNGDLGWS